MDIQLLQQVGVSASTIALLAIAYRIFQYIKGKKIVSDCCGTQMEVGIDVRNMDSPIDGTADSTHTVRVKTPRQAPKKTQVQDAPQTPN